MVAHKIKLFFRLNWRKKAILLEAYFYLGLARVIKLLPMSRIAPLLGKKSEETSFSVRKEEREQLASVSESIHMMCRYTFWESACLVRAIAAQMMLRRRKIASTLYLGTGKDETGAFIAHAWLRSGPYYLTGREGRRKFTTVAMFAKDQPGVEKNV
ncbi:lasso peptide biosynthesis B2 protein [Virgibacillus sp. W0430]|uniref:lasso peptide biosynthesis B2 protein n=1 Tax=Virgibacillus sp. W0430 TaxID=3391580 RepID=UPI003F45E955